MNRALKFLVTLVLLPTVLLLAWGVCALTVRIALNLSFTMPFVAGAFIYAFMHYFFFRPARVYVLAHELTHAAAAVISGVKVGKISVGRSGGSVTLSGSSTFISLAPYCLPLFAAVLAVVYRLSGFFMDIMPYRPWFTAGIGFFLLFHILHTAESLLGHTQSDLKKAGGVLFSVTLIMLANSLVLFLSFKLLFPGIIPARQYFSGVWSNTAYFWQSVFLLTRKAVVKAGPFLETLSPF
ncbi:MAG: hypothetical protein ABIG11_08485 [bacterium]